MVDAFITGFMGAIAAVMLCFTRGRQDLILNHFVFAMLLFFTYHVCREFAGYFTIFGTEEQTTLEQKETQVLTRPLIVVFVVAFIIASILAILSHSVPDFTWGVFKSFEWKTPFFIETLLFAFLISVGEIVVAYNHSDPILPSFGTSMAMFIVLHIILQAGGFYDHLYS